MAVRAETGQGLNINAVKEGNDGSLSHKDLINLAGADYRELVFRSLRLFKIVNDISELQFKDRTERHVKPNGHKSDGHYFLDQKMNNHRIFGYVLKPEPEENGESVGMTSEHMHWREDREMVEHYFVLKGSMYLILDKRSEETARVVELRSEDKPHIMVPSMTYHQAEITEGFALVLVIMPDTADIPDSELHIPRE